MGLGKLRYYLAIPFAKPRKKTRGTTIPMGVRGEQRGPITYHTIPLLPYPFSSYLTLNIPFPSTNRLDWTLEILLLPVYHSVIVKERGEGNEREEKGPIMYIVGRGGGRKGGKANGWTHYVHPSMLPSWLLLLFPLSPTASPSLSLACLKTGLEPIHIHEYVLILARYLAKVSRE